MSFNNIQVNTINWEPYPPAITPVILPLNDIPVGTGSSPPLKDSGIEITAFLGANSKVIDFDKTHAGNDFIGYLPGTIGVGVVMAAGYSNSEQSNLSIINGSANKNIQINNQGAGNLDLLTTSGNINIKPAGDSGSNGDILTSDGLGNATWQAPPASGNSVLTAVYSNQLGTTMTATTYVQIPWSATPLFNNIPTLQLQVDNITFKNTDLVAHIYQVLVNLEFQNSGATGLFFTYQVTIFNSTIGNNAAQVTQQNIQSTNDEIQCVGTFLVNAGDNFIIYGFNGNTADTDLNTGEGPYQNSVCINQLS